MRHRGIFTYSAELASLIDAEIELAYSSEMEVELRAATVITVDNIFAEVQQKGSDKLKSQLRCPNEVDYVLW